MLNKIYINIPTTKYLSKYTIDRVKRKAEKLRIQNYFYNSNEIKVSDCLTTLLKNRNIVNIVKPTKLTHMIK